MILFFKKLFVARREFESLISAVKGRCPKPSRRTGHLPVTGFPAIPRWDGYPILPLKAACFCCVELHFTGQLLKICAAGGIRTPKPIKDLIYNQASHQLLNDGIVGRPYKKLEKLSSLVVYNQFYRVGREGFEPPKA